MIGALLMTTPTGTVTDCGSDDLRKDELTPDKKGHGTLQNARREILRLVCLNSAAITQAVINDALQGKYLSAKFLFEAVGLLGMDAEELENPEGHESLASLLLKRWELAPEGGDITEVPEVMAVVAPAHEAPVEL